MKNKEITVLDQEIHINKDDYFSLTDIAKYKNPEDPRFVIQNWMRRIDTIQYIGLWEQLNNPNFNRVEFDTFRSEAGHNYFTMTPKKWIDGVNAIGIISKAGKYNGGTYAHKDIALQFASWISPEINLYIIKEFQRLKADEQKQIGWTVKRELAKINYCIHTDAIKDNIIIPLEITREQASFVYASEADVLNVALFGVPQTLLKRKSIVAFSPCFLTWLQRQRKKLPYASSLENLMPLCDSKQCLRYEQQLLISFIFLSHSSSPATNLTQSSERESPFTIPLWEPAPSCLFPVAHQPDFAFRASRFPFCSFSKGRPSRAFNLSLLRLSDSAESGVMAADSSASAIDSTAVLSKSIRKGHFLKFKNDPLEIQFHRKKPFLLAFASFLYLS